MVWWRSVIKSQDLNHKTLTRSKSNWQHQDLDYNHQSPEQDQEQTFLVADRSCNKNSLRLHYSSEEERFPFRSHSDPVLNRRDCEGQVKKIGFDDSLLQLVSARSLEVAISIFIDAQGKCCNCHQHVCLSMVNNTSGLWVVGKRNEIRVRLLLTIW